MVFWNLLNGRSSRSRPLLEPSKSMRGGTNPRQQPPSSWQVSRCWLVWIFLVHDEFFEYSIQESSTLARNH
jgi:hypothetical protein